MMLLLPRERDFDTPHGKKLIEKAFRQGSEQAADFPPISVVEVKGGFIVTFVYGDGTSDRFRITFTPERKALVPISEVKLGYRCVTNPKVKLEILGDTTTYVGGNQLLFYDKAMYGDLSYKLTTEEGTKIYLSKKKGVYKLEDSNGNTITVDENGYHSADRTFAYDKKHTLQTMYNVNLIGLMSGISNVVVNSVLGKQGMELISSFFEGYQNGLYLTSILYLTVAVQVCALSVPVQAAYASTTEIKSLIYSRVTIRQVNMSII